MVNSANCGLILLEIAAKQIALKGIDAQGLLEICPNYAPFLNPATSADAGAPQPGSTAVQFSPTKVPSPPLFEASIHFTGHLELNLADAQHAEIYKYADYTISVSPSLQNVCINFTLAQHGCVARIHANASFSNCHIALQNSQPKLAEALNLALMVCFTSAGQNNGLLLLHAASIALNNRCCLFIGKSGTGKSTHAQLWLAHIAGSSLLNDDCTAVYNLPDGRFKAYTTPWNSNIPSQHNTSCILQTIVRLKQSATNAIARISPIQAFASLLPTCAGWTNTSTATTARFQTIEALATHIPHFELQCLPNQAAAECCCQTIFSTPPYITTNRETLSKHPIE